jgi:Arm DNA-binding domain
MFDERGLFLLVTATGSKLWRFKYMFDGREKLLSFGSFPDVPLRMARDKRDEASADALGRGTHGPQREGAGGTRGACRYIRADRAMSTREMNSRRELELVKLLVDATASD